MMKSRALKNCSRLHQHLSKQSREELIMTNKNTNQSWALILVFLGLLFLATNFGWFGWLTSWLWSLLFIGAGTAFLYVYYQNRERWWALIPGFALLAVGVAALSGNAAGGLFLALIGAGFASVFLTNRARWWAVIPAGGLLTLALIAWLGAARPAWDTGWLFFTGIAATFGVLFLLPEGQGKQSWAIYPTLGCLALVLLTFFSSNLVSIMISLALITGGAFLFWRQGKATSTSIDNSGSKDKPGGGSSGSPQPH
jgi:hypothetical protein